MRQAGGTGSIVRFERNACEQELGAAACEGSLGIGTYLEVGGERSAGFKVNAAREANVVGRVPQVSLCTG